MVKVRNFQESLEKDIDRLAVEVKERAAQAAAEKLPEREVVKQSLQTLTAQTPLPAPAQDETASPILPNYLQAGDPRVKIEVERLVELVFKDGLAKAVREAKRHPAFVEDAFHDALVDKLLPELKKRGALK